MQRKGVIAFFALFTTTIAGPLAKLQYATEIETCYTTVYVTVPPITSTRLQTSISSSLSSHYVPPVPTPTIPSDAYPAISSIASSVQPSIASPVLPSFASPNLPSIVVPSLVPSASPLVPVPSAPPYIPIIGTSAIYVPSSTSAAAARPSSGSISVTPHGNYSSSVGVLGCKINIDRVAYWPGWPDCNNYCVKVTAKGRSVHLLLVDSSASAHDISYDAWNYLNCGRSATEHPTYGGGIPATYKMVPNSECADLMYTPDNSLPLTAANSVDWYNSCPSGAASLYNIYTPQCDLGVDELCKMPPPSKGNQPICPTMLGDKRKTNFGIKDIVMYQTSPSE